MIEAVFEEMDIKKRVFADLDRAGKGRCSARHQHLDARRRRDRGCDERPQDVIGTHFFSPANVMRLLEIVRGAATSPDALATAVALARRIGKVPVIVGVCYGFVGNRMLARRSVEAERLLVEGALPQEVDAAVTGFGFPMGPFAMADMAGLDVGWRIRKGRGERNEIEDALVRDRAFRPEDRERILSLRAGAARRCPIPRSSRSSSMLRPGSASPAGRSRRRRSSSG